MSRVVYDSRVPQGAGTTGENFKPTRVNIPNPNGPCFSNMQSVSDLQMLCASAPADHDVITQRLKARGRIKEQQRRNSNHVSQVKVKAGSKPVFSRGATVRDRDGRKGIIIKANAGHTAKSHTPVHRISDDNGRSWMAKETHLKLLY